MGQLLSTGQDKAGWEALDAESGTLTGSERCEEMTHPQEVRLILAVTRTQVQGSHTTWGQLEGLRQARVPHRWGGTQKPGVQEVSFKTLGR